MIILTEDEFWYKVSLKVASSCFTCFIFEFCPQKNMKNCSENIKQFYKNEVDNNEEELI
jgi:hypothetical protein